jgi:hypothetical protein
MIVNRTRQLTSKHIDLIGKIKSFKAHACADPNKGPVKLSSHLKSESASALNQIESTFKSTSMINTSFLVLKPKPACIDTTKIPSFLRQQTMPLLRASRSVNLPNPPKLSSEGINLDKDQTISSPRNGLMKGNGVPALKKSKFLHKKYNKIKKLGSAHKVIFFISRKSRVIISYKN